MIYETTDDHLHKIELATVFAKKYDCKINILPRLSPMDALFQQNGVNVYAEIKRRRNASTRYTTLMIDKSKLDWCVENKCHGIALIEWDDCIAWINLREPHTVSKGGRYDRNDPYDIDTCCFYPVKNFTIFLEKENVVNDNS